MKSLGFGYLCVVGLMSLITFVCYGWDKHQARVGRQRISEIRLHVLALLGGWPGALVAREIFSHKTRKTWFTFKTWLIIAIHMVLIATVCFYLLNARISPGRSL